MAHTLGISRKSGKKLALDQCTLRHISFCSGLLPRVFLALHIYNELMVRCGFNCHGFLTRNSGHCSFNEAAGDLKQTFQHDYQVNSPG